MKLTLQVLCVQVRGPRAFHRAWRPMRLPWCGGESSTIEVEPITKSSVTHSDRLGKRKETKCQGKLLMMHKSVQFSKISVKRQANKTSQSQSLNRKAIACRSARGWRFGRSPGWFNSLQKCCDKARQLFRPRRLSLDLECRQIATFIVAHAGLRCEI